MTGYLPPDRNFLAIPDEISNPETAGVIVLPVPFERTTSYRKGAGQGPQAIIDASHQVEFFDAVLGIEPVQAAGGIATLTPRGVAGLSAEELAESLRESVSDWLKREKFVVTLGGEHTSVVGAIKAHCEAFDDLTVVQLDAHADLRPEYEGDPWSHACAAARILDFHDSLVQVGIRSQDRDERTYSEEHKIPVFYAHEIHRCQEDREDWIGLIVRSTRKRVYLTFDCDVFDPSVVPAVGTPEPGGLTWSQVDRFLARICREREVVGIDFSELSPISGLEYPQFNMAKLVYRFIGYSATSSHASDDHNL